MTEPSTIVFGFDFTQNDTPSTAPKMLGFLYIFECKIMENLDGAEGWNAGIPKIKSHFMSFTNLVAGKKWKMRWDWLWTCVTWVLWMEVAKYGVVCFKVIEIGLRRKSNLDFEIDTPSIFFQCVIFLFGTIFKK